MELIRGINNIRDTHRGCVLTIGNFDGVHLGHQAVLKQLVRQAKKMALPSVVMLFEPQPREFFTPLDAPARLTLFRDKYQQLKKLGVERVLVIHFNQAFSALSAHDFVYQLLVEKLGVKYLIVGDDFCFGAKRQGNFTFLQTQAEKAGFTVVSTKSFILSEKRVSSTVIRQTLISGELELANTLLGRPFSISGRVGPGKKLGRTIGFPTANIALKRAVSPVLGVYVVQVAGIKKDTWLGGVANVGTRPTVDGAHQQLEVHLFDIDKNIYGQYIEVRFLYKLRDEMKFNSLDALIAQIHLDAQAARARLSGIKNI